MDELINKCMEMNKPIDVHKMNEFPDRSASSVLSLIKDKAES